MSMSGSTGSEDQVGRSSGVYVFEVMMQSMFKGGNGTSVPT